MKSLRWFAPAALLSTFLLAAVASQANAQVSINIQFGHEPGCPYGYFNYAPYSCAPFGYYGPQWFMSGIFVGAGPWFHGPEGFRGYVNRSYDPRYGYRGRLPSHDERADWGRHRDWERHFRGNEFHDERRHDDGDHHGEYRDHDDHGNGRDNGHDNDHGNGRNDDHGHNNDRGNGHNDDHGNGHGNDHGNGHSDDHGHDHDHN